MENYSRFYAIFNRLPYVGDREEFKKSLVLQHTGNRTEHLHEMTDEEYECCCRSMETVAKPSSRSDWSPQLRELKRQRSIALHQLQLYGVDTADWNKVNAFCLQPRIAGKVFRDLDCEELEALTKKMRVIIRKRDEAE